MDNLEEVVRSNRVFIKSIIKLIEDLEKVITEQQERIEKLENRPQEFKTGDY